MFIFGTPLQNPGVAVVQAIKRTAWYPKRRAYRTLYWREISPLAVPIFLKMPVCY